ncbi:MAG: hypothetical protein SFV51_14730 [Bryobacteraceae bacterium]|nr:hypothetical protein [Bryobacteraceae bacterium]
MLVLLLLALPSGVALLAAGVGWLIDIKVLQILCKRQWRNFSC